MALSFFEGTLTPKGDFPIYNTIANKNQVTDYTFSFIADNTVPKTGYVEVIFPHQFPDGLGLSGTPTCQSQKEDENELTLTCISSTKSVEIYLSEIILIGLCNELPQYHINILTFFKPINSL